MHPELCTFDVITSDVSLTLFSVVFLFFSAVCCFTHVFVGTSQSPHKLHVIAVLTPRTHINTLYIRADMTERTTSLIKRSAAI